MRYPSEGTMEGSFWTIQHKRKSDADWTYTNYDTVPGVIYERSYEAWQRYGSRGFVTQYAARKAIAKLRSVAVKSNARWGCWSGYKFRLVLVKFCIEVEEAR